MARKLKPGVHNVRVGGKLRRVKVLANGQWRFLKGKPRASPGPRKRASAKRGKVKRARRTSPGRRNPNMARRKMKLPNRIINAALFALAFARPLSKLFSGDFTYFTNPPSNTNSLIYDATAGLAAGRFDPVAAGRMYGPPGAAFILFEIKKMAMKKFRF